MRNLRTSTILAATLFALLAALPAHAVSNRIFMSTNGNNASDCANPLTPCLTFSGALAQVNPGGEVIAEATGGYGPLSITQAVTISGPPGVVIYSGLQVTVNAPGAIVVLRGLTIDGTGALANGINVVAVGSLFIESCVIANFAGSSTSQGNGIFFGSAGDLFVKDTVIRNNGDVGIYVDPTSGAGKASIDHCRLDGNGWGLVSFGNSVVTVRDSAAFASSTAGFLGEGGELNIENCVAANGNFGIATVSGSVVRVSNTTVTDNVTGLSVASGGTFSRDRITRSRETPQKAPSPAPSRRTEEFA
jgi:hypothetical protein